LLAQLAIVEIAPGAPGADTVPLTVPAAPWTVIIKTGRSNVTVTVFDAPTVTVHSVGVVGLGPQPCQPPNREVAAGVAVSVTSVPSLKGAVHVV
jgi:hypothetical protein